MRVHLLIGPSGESTARFRTILKHKGANLEKLGIMAPDWNHIRLYMACSDSEDVSVVRYLRGFSSGEAQRALYKHLGKQLREFADNPDISDLVLSSGQLGGLMHRAEELERLKALLTSVSDEIRISAYVGEQTSLLLPRYCEQVLNGRRTSLEREVALTKGDSWWSGALAMNDKVVPEFGLFNDIQAPLFWLDYQALADFWESVFGEGSVTLRPLDLHHLDSADGASALNTLLGIDDPMGQLEPVKERQLPSAAWLARIRQLNDILIRWMQVKDRSLTRKYWKTIVNSTFLDGPPIAPGELHELADYFEPLNTELVKKHELLTSETFAKPRTISKEPWQEADPQFGFRATQVVSAFDWGIRKNSEKREDLVSEEEEIADFDNRLKTILPDEQKSDIKGSQSKKEFLDMLKVNHRIVLSTHIKPHNQLGSVPEDEDQAAYDPMPLRALTPPSTGNVIVGCMKNEAPYIVEWVAYHRAIGIDNFLIYTNDCSDGTSEILDHLQKMGVVEHRNNDKWRGKSPQQHALNMSLKEPMIKEADWIIHIDVDEFINVRCGNGTLDDFFARVPNATNVAMTWRLFGHNNVTELRDDLVIDQFDTCAPKFCPKPHTVWGFKTMFKNIGAYAKISCHRPNKLADDFRDKVQWVNGSGQDMTADAVDNGWRNSKKNIGYDLIQLNHYALRSAESFLIKRQRGRALHVDRSIGLNYWIRMDWSDFRDVTIKRNVPRVRAEIDRLMQDKTLKKLHDAGFAWHQAKSRELQSTPEFRDLFDQAVNVKLNETERVAYALALDMES
ncbi:MAG: glycosyltransferase family 2 protein [Arenibacterium sp.]